MREPQLVSLTNVVGSPYCVSSSDGEKVYGIVAAALRADSPVELSFSGVEDLTTAFLNTAVGQLYGEFEDHVIRRNLSPVDADRDQLELLKRVVERAKAFFREPERYAAATAEAFAD